MFVRLTCSPLVLLLLLLRFLFCKAINYFNGILLQTYKGLSSLDGFYHLYCVKCVDKETNKAKTLQSLLQQPIYIQRGLQWLFFRRGEGGPGVDPHELFSFISQETVQLGGNRCAGTLTDTH